MSRRRKAKSKGKKKTGYQDKQNTYPYIHTLKDKEVFSNSTLGEAETAKPIKIEEPYRFQDGITIGFHTHLLKR